MKIKEILTELFNAVSPFKWVKSTKTHAMAKFKVGDIGYDVDFSAGLGNDWEFIFQAVVQKSVRRIGTGKTTIPQKTFKLTGTRSEFIVFATIMKILEEFIVEYKPDSVTWSADKSEESRISLYQMLLTKFKPKLGALGYDIESHASDRDFASFRIVKIGTKAPDFDAYAA